MTQVQPGTHTEHLESRIRELEAERERLRRAVGVMRDALHRIGSAQDCEHCMAIAYKAIDTHENIRWESP